MAKSGNNDWIPGNVFFDSQKLRNRLGFLRILFLSKDCDRMRPTYNWKLQLLPQWPVVLPISSFRWQDPREWAKPRENLNGNLRQTVAGTYWHIKVLLLLLLHSSIRERGVETLNWLNPGIVLASDQGRTKGSRGDDEAGWSYTHGAVGRPIWPIKHVERWSSSALLVGLRILSSNFPHMLLSNLLALGYYM